MDSPFSKIIPGGSVLKALKYTHANEGIYVSMRDPQYGDVIFVERCNGLYRHFGIYIGNDKVIHFAAPDGDFDKKNAYIHETSLDHFKDGSEVYVMTFSEKYESSSVLKKLNIEKLLCYKLQTPEETVARAKSMLGRRGLADEGYDVVYNNCEDFAIWCKTNIAESKQVSDYLNRLLKRI